MPQFNPFIFSALPWQHAISRETVDTYMSAQYVSLSLRRGFDLDAYIVLVCVCSCNQSCHYHTNLLITISVYFIYTTYIRSQYSGLIGMKWGLLIWLLHDCCKFLRYQLLKRAENLADVLTRPGSMLCDTGFELPRC